MDRDDRAAVLMLHFLLRNPQNFFQLQVIPMWFASINRWGNNPMWFRFFLIAFAILGLPCLVQYASIIFFEHLALMLQGGIKVLITLWHIFIAADYLWEDCKAVQFNLYQFLKMSPAKGGSCAVSIRSFCKPSLVQRVVSSVSRALETRTVNHEDHLFYKGIYILYNFWSLSLCPVDIQYVAIKMLWEPTFSKKIR